MSVIAKQSSADREHFRRIGQQLVARQQQLQRFQFLKVAAVWVVLFAILGGLLYLLRIDLSYMSRFLKYVLAGFWVTLYVSFILIFAATVLAFFGALGRLSTNAIAQGVSGFYISLLRGTPLLVQIYIIYSGLPQIGSQLSALGYPTLGNFLILSATQSGILALSLNYGAYMTEIFRAGIQ